MEQHSHGLRRLAALEAARGSFDDAAEAIERATGSRLGKRQVEALAGRAAVDVDDFYAQRRPQPGAVPRTCWSCRPTARASSCAPRRCARPPPRPRPRPPRKLSTRLSKGEKRNRKRLAEVGAVYDADPVAAHPRRHPRPHAASSPAQPAQAPVAANKWLTASVTDDAATVVGRVFDEADRRDPTTRATWVALVDGNNHQIDRIQAEATQRGIEVTIVVDFIHVLEYLWRAAWSFRRRATPPPRSGCRTKRSPSCRARPPESPPASAAPTTVAGLDPPQRASADACATYLINKEPYLDYPTALPTAGRSPPASSKAPAATSSRTAWTSPAPAGD